MIFFYLSLISYALGFGLNNSFKLPEGAGKPTKMDGNNVYVAAEDHYVAYDFSGGQQANFTPESMDVEFVPDQYYWYEAGVNETANTYTIRMNTVAKNGSCSGGDSTLIGDDISGYAYSYVAGQVFIHVNESGKHGMNFYGGDGRHVWGKTCIALDGYQIAAGKTEIINYKLDVPNKQLLIVTCADGKSSDTDKEIPLDDPQTDTLVTLIPNSDTTGWIVYNASETTYNIAIYSGNFEKQGDELIINKTDGADYSFFTDGGSLIIQCNQSTSISFSRLTLDGNYTLVWEQDGTVGDVLTYDDQVVVPVDDTYYVFTYESEPTSDDSDNTYLIIGGIVLIGLAVAGAAVFYFKK